MLGQFLGGVLGVAVGALLPAYFSYKAILAKDSREYFRWMRYWTVYGLFLSVATVLDLLLFWLPLYYEAKLLFQLFIVLPHFKGSEYVFREFVIPALHPYEPVLDGIFDQLRDRTHLSGLMATLYSKGKDLVSHAVAAAHSEEGSESTGPRSTPASRHRDDLDGPDLAGSGGPAQGNVTMTRSRSRQQGSVGRGATYKPASHRN